MFERNLELFLYILHTIQILDQLFFRLIIQVYLLIVNERKENKSEREHKDMDEIYEQWILSALFFITVIICALFTSIRVHQYPCIVGGIIMAIIQISEQSNRYYFNLVPNFQNFQTYWQWIFMAFNMYCNYLSWKLIRQFGWGDFSKFKATGPFSIGYKTIYA